MQERNPLSLCSNARLFVDELNAGCAAALECGVEVIDGKADVVDSRTALRHEARDRRGWIIRLQGFPDDGLLLLDKAVTVDDAAFIATSFPGFADLMRGLGGDLQ